MRRRRIRRFATGEASGVIVLDVDGDRGAFAALAELEQQHGPVPITPRVVTGRGEHIYFSYMGMHLKNTAGKLGTGLDVRCCGGYVLAAGGTHRNGRIYAWKRGCRPEQVAFAPAPTWLTNWPACRRRQSSVPDEWKMNWRSTGC